MTPRKRLEEINVPRLCEVCSHQWKSKDGYIWIVICPKCGVSGYHQPAYSQAQAGEELQPDGYAYRYHDCISYGNGGREVNGNKPIEAIPFYFRKPPAQAQSGAEGPRCPECGATDMELYVVGTEIRIHCSDTQTHAAWDVFRVADFRKFFSALSAPTLDEAKAQDKPICPKCGKSDLRVVVFDDYRMRIRCFKCGEHFDRSDGDQFFLSDFRKFFPACGATTAVTSPDGEAQTAEQLAATFKAVMQPAYQFDDKPRATAVSEAAEKDGGTK